MRFSLSLHSVSLGKASDIIMNILVINDNSAHVNWGAQASPPALYGIIKNRFSNCTISSFTHEWLTRSFHRRMEPLLGGRLLREKKRWRPIRSFINNFSTIEPFYPEVADDFDCFADEWLAGFGGPQGNEFLAYAAKADLVVYNGENSIYRNTPEGCHGIFLLWLTKTRLGKPSCIVNHTAQQNGVLPIMDGMIQLVFPKLDLVAVREPCSLDNLQKLGINNAKMFPDVVFSFRPLEFSRVKIEKWRQQYNLLDQSYFCFSASGLPVSKPRGLWDGEVTELVRNLKALGLQAVLLAKDPWCLFLEEVAKRTDSIFFGPDHQFHDLWPLFEGASFLVTGHYHYAIFCAMVGCPFVPMTVTNHKMRGLCRLLQWKHSQPFDATYLGKCGNQIVAEASSLMKNRIELNAHLINVTAKLREDAIQLGESIAGMLKKEVVNDKPICCD